MENLAAIMQFPYNTRRANPGRGGVTARIAGLDRRGYGPIMTEGLAVLGGWLELLAMLVVLGVLVSRPRRDG